MADESQQVSQDEIEQMLKQSQGAAAAGAPSTSGGLGPGEVAALTAQAAATSANEGALGQAEIESLMRGKGGAASAAEARRPRAGGGNDLGITPPDMEFLLDQAAQALASVESPNRVTPAGAATFRFEEFGGAPASAESATLDLIRDVELDLKIELGRTQMYLEEVLKLRRGSVVALDKLAGDPVDIYVNGRLIARGEVLVLNDNFCVRVAELIAGQESGAA
jgi:flagellar motor switch protein FliN/FliY